MLTSPSLRPSHTLGSVYWLCGRAVNVSWSQLSLPSLSILVLRTNSHADMTGHFQDWIKPQTACALEECTDYQGWITKVWTGPGPCKPQFHCLSVDLWLFDMFKYFWEYSLKKIIQTTVIRTLRQWLPILGKSRGSMCQNRGLDLYYFSWYCICIVHTWK